MTASTIDFLKTVAERGFVHQCTDAESLGQAMNGGPVTAYIGFDCTAPSLHAGHLLSIMLLRRLQKAGHKPVVLRAAARQVVGDPSGKDESRKLLTNETIAANMAGVKTIFENF